MPSKNQNGLRHQRFVLQLARVSKIFGFLVGLASHSDFWPFSHKRSLVRIKWYCRVVSWNRWNYQSSLVQPVTLTGWAGRTWEPCNSHLCFLFPLVWCHIEFDFFGFDSCGRGEVWWRCSFLCSQGRGSQGGVCSGVGHWVDPIMLLLGFDGLSIGSEYRFHGIFIWKMIYPPTNPPTNPPTH